MLQYFTYSYRALVGHVRGRLGAGASGTGVSQSNTKQSNVTEETRHNSTTQLYDELASSTTLSRSSSLPARLSVLPDQFVRCQTENSQRPGPDLARTSLHTEKRGLTSCVHTHNGHGQSSSIPINYSMPALTLCTGASTTTLLPHDIILQCIPHSDSWPIFPRAGLHLKQDKLQSAVGKINLNVDLSYHLNNSSSPSLATTSKVIRDGIKTDSSGYFSQMEKERFFGDGLSLSSSKSFLGLSILPQTDDQLEIVIEPDTHRSLESPEDTDTDSDYKPVKFSLGDSYSDIDPADKHSYSDCVSSTPNLNPTLARLDSFGSDFNSNEMWITEGTVNNEPHCLTGYELVAGQEFVMTQNGQGSGCAQFCWVDKTDDVMRNGLKPTMKSFSEVCMQ